MQSTYVLAMCCPWQSLAHRVSIKRLVKGQLLALLRAAGSGDHRCRTLHSPKWRYKAAGQWKPHAACPDSQD